MWWSSARKPQSDGANSGVEHGAKRYKGAVDQKTLMIVGGLAAAAYILPE